MKPTFIAKQNQWVESIFSIMWQNVDDFVPDITTCLRQREVGGSLNEPILCDKLANGKWQTIFDR